MTLRFQSQNFQSTINISMNERAMAYGDGHFTTAKIINGKVVYLNLHINRLIKASQRLKLPECDWAMLRQHLIEVARDHQLAVIKVMVTSGEGGRGYSRLGIHHCNVYVSVSDFPLHYQQWQEVGISVGFSDFKLASHSALAGLKHLNRIEQVMIRAELDTREEQDIIVLDHHEHIIETSCANVFWLKNGRWHTPSLENSGIDGIIRQILIEQLKPEEEQFTRQDLTKIEAMFICNSVMGIVPIKELDKTLLSIAFVERIKGVLK